MKYDNDVTEINELSSIPEFTRSHRMHLISKHGLAHPSKTRDVKGVILTTTKLDSPTGSFVDDRISLLEQFFSFSTLLDEMKDGPIPTPNDWWQEEQYLLVLSFIKF